MRKKQQPMKTYLVDLKLKKAVQVTLDECCNFRQFNGVHNFNSQKWIKLVNKSSLHSAICRTKIDMTKGKGLIYDSEGNQEAADFVQKNFIDEDLLEKLATDKVIFNNFAFFTQWNNAGTKVGLTEHIPFKKFLAIKDKECEKVTKGRYLVGDRPTYNLFNPYLAAKYSIANYGADGQPTQIYFKNNYWVDNDIYGHPDYAGSEDYILIDIFLGEYHLGNVQRGFFPSVIIETDVPQYYSEHQDPNEPAPNGNPKLVENEEFKQLVNGVEDWFQGAENAGSVLFIEKGKDGPRLVIKPFEASANVDLFKSLNETTQQKIISAHRLSSPTLVGYAGSGTLSGNAGEISVAAELFYNTVIIPAYQDPILNALKDILKANGYSTKLSIKQSKPVQFTLSEAVLMQTLKINEIREILGYENIENGNRRLGEGQVFTGLETITEEEVIKIKKFLHEYNSAS